VGNFMKDIGQKIKVKLPEGILTNHTGRKTAAQILQDADVSEDAIMNFTGHKSVQGPLRNSNKINQVSSTIPEITGLHVNSNTNTVAQDINMVQGEFQNQRSIFNNCHFTN
ncbi:6318_t:CDS:2, partial [Gigaspora rosea]